MKIMLVINSLGRGGAERIMTALGNHWAETGHQITLVTFSADQQIIYRLNPAIQRVCLDFGGKSRSVVGALARNIRGILRLRRYLRTERPVVVVSFMMRANVLILIASRGLNCKVIVSERSDPRHSHIRCVWFLLCRIMYKFADQVVLQTEAVKCWFQSAIGTAAYVVIPNPLTEGFVSELPYARSLREILNVGQEAKIVIALGQLKKHKGFDFLIQAFNLVHIKHPRWHLVIFGEGEERHALHGLAQQLDMDAYVHLPGLTESPRHMLTESDMFVLSSRYEGFPNVLLEAMACGLPAVSFACPSGPEEIITHNRDGVLVKHGDVEGLSQAMALLMEDDSRRSILGNNARKSVQRYAPAMILSRWDEMLGAK